MGRAARNLTSHVLCLLLQVVGSLWQPEIMRDAPVALRSLIEGPTGRASAAQVLLSCPGGTAVALCRRAIPPERAAAWADGLLSHVRAQRILIVASLPVRFVHTSRAPGVTHDEVHDSEARSRGPYLVQSSDWMIGKQYMVFTHGLQALAGAPAKTASPASLGSPMV